MILTILVLKNGINMLFKLHQDLMFLEDIKKHIKIWVILSVMFDLNILQIKINV